MQKNIFFEEDRDYKDVYFMIVDTKEHSKIVQYNDSDKVDMAFDEFENVVFGSVHKKAEQKRCAIAESWGWQGDGGLFIFFDQKESFARETAISSAKEILEQISGLNDNLRRSEVSGEIHVRIALHKGSLRYKQARGSIHSRELNLTSHVEKVVPSDTFAISKEIYDISGRLQKEFVETEGTFENMKFYLCSKRPHGDILDEWKWNLTTFGEKRIARVIHALVGLESDVPLEELGLSGVFSQRALTPEYVQLIRESSECIWAIGVGLGGFQSDHRERVLLPKALEGVDIRLLVADPNVLVKVRDNEFSLPSWRDYAIGGGDYNETSRATIAKTVDTINRRIKKNPSAKKKYIKLKYYETTPTVAMLRIDSTLYLSPYFVQQPSFKCCTLKFASESRLYDQCIRHFTSIWDDKRYSREAPDVFQG